MNQHSQMHFDGMYPTEADSHGSSNYGDDIGKENASSADDMDLQEDHGVDVVMPAGDQNGLIADDIDLQDELGDDVGTDSSEQKGSCDDYTSSGSVLGPDDEDVTDVPGMTAGTDWRTDRRRVAMESPEWDYSVSHHAFRVRGMTDEEYSALVEDISTHGLRLSIIRWKGEIIDGVHRLLACLEAGVEPTFEDVPDDVDPETYVHSTNVVRRHLTLGEKAELAARLSSESKRGRPRLSDGINSVNLRNKIGSFTQAESASLVKISPKSVSHGVRVFSSDSSAIPELQQAVREDTISVSDASRVVNESPEVQRKAVELVAAGESRTAVDGVRQARRESGPPRWKDADVVSPAYEKDGICIHQAGVYGLLEGVKAGSVDLVICASKAPEEAGDGTLASAATFASDVLSTEGILILAADPGRLPQQLAKFARRKKLEWICQVHVLFDSPISNTGEPHYIEQRCVPLLLFGKPGARLDGGDDVILATPQPEGSANQTPSIENASDLVIRRFVKPGQLVCFPNLSGWNSALFIAAAAAGCKIIAVDSDQSRIRRLTKELSKLKVTQFSDDRAGA